RREPTGHPHLRGHVDPVAHPVQGWAGGRPRDRRQAEGRDPARPRAAPVARDAFATALRGSQTRVMRVFHPGDRGPEILAIQHRLSSLGSAMAPDELTGAFGPTTEVAIRSFQGLRHLPVDGLVGPDTWMQLVEAGFRLGDRTLYLHVPPFRGDD